MIDAPGDPIALSRYSVDDRQDGNGEVRGVGWIAALVVHNADLRPILGEPQHRLDEVVPEGAHHPGRAQDDVSWAGYRHASLTLELAAAVDAERGDGVVLHVRRGLAAVEDVVC